MAVAREALEKLKLRSASLICSTQVKAAVTSSFMFGEPLVTVLFATISGIGEITLFTVAGDLLIFGGVYLVTRRQGTATCFRRK